MSYRGKVVLLGDAKVGKTSLLARYVDGVFSEEYVQTIGANFLIKEIDLKKIIEKLNIEDEALKEEIKRKDFKLYYWDITGQKDKLFVAEYYFDYAIAAMIVFNLSDRESFKNLDFWISKMKELSGDIPYIIVGNKSDLKREVNEAIIEEKVKSLRVMYIETSAKLNRNVEEAFEILSVQILDTLR